MLIFLIATLALAGTAAAGSSVLVHQPERRQRRRAQREAREAQEATDRERERADRENNRPPTLTQRIQQHGLGPVTDLEIEQARRDAVPQRRRIDDSTREVEETRSSFERDAKATLGHGHSAARTAMVSLFSVAWLIATYLVFQLEAGIIGLLLPGVGALRFALAFIAVLVTAGLGLLIVERLRPTGAVAAWRDQTWQKRLPAAIAMLVLFAALLVFYANLATVRSESVLGPRVAASAAACREVTAEGDKTTATVACAKADREQDLLKRSREWDQAAAVLAPSGELVFGGFAFEGILLLAATQKRRKLRQAEDEERRELAALEDRQLTLTDTITAAAMEAGVHPDAIRAELALRLQTPAANADGDEAEDPPVIVDPGEDDQEPPEPPADTAPPDVPIPPVPTDPVGPEDPFPPLGAFGDPPVSPAPDTGPEAGPTPPDGLPSVI